MDIAGSRSCAIRQENAGGGLVLAQLLQLPRPIARHPLAHRIAVLGCGDGGLKQLRELHRSMIGDQPRPCSDGSRHRYCVGALGWDRLHAAGKTAVEACGCRRPSRPIERDDLALATRHVQHEAIPTNAGLRGFDDPEQGDGRDGSVHRVAAATQHVQRGQRCQRVRRCRHDAHAQRLGASGQFEIAGGVATEWQETRSAHP
jgi:hypothetical protein